MVTIDPPWSIRRAEPAEAPELSALAYRSKAHWGYSRAFMEACRDELTYDAERVRRRPFYALRDDAGLAGFYALVPIAPDALELDALFVEPRHQGRGWGRALVAHARETARTLGAERIDVQSDPHADGFYEAVGARPTGARESRSVEGRMLRTFTIELDAPPPERRRAPRRPAPAGPRAFLRLRRPRR